MAAVGGEASGGVRRRGAVAGAVAATKASASERVEADAIQARWRWAAGRVAVIGRGIGRMGGRGEGCSEAKKAKAAQRQRQRQRRVSECIVSVARWRRRPPTIAPACCVCRRSWFPCCRWSDVSWLGVLEASCVVRTVLGGARGRPFAGSSHREQQHLDTAPPRLAHTAAIMVTEHAACSAPGCTTAGRRRYGEHSPRTLVLSAGSPPPPPLTSAPGLASQSVTTLKCWTPSIYWQLLDLCEQRGARTCV